MPSLSKFRLIKHAEKKSIVFGSSNLNNSELFRHSYKNIFLEGTLNTYAKRNESTVDSSGKAAVKVLWCIIAYHTVFLTNSAIIVSAYFLCPSDSVQ